MPGVTVIIPTHNRPHLLPRAVESARAGGREVEIIVIDDASVDETARVCAELTGIKYVRLQRRQGVAGARNVGILNSTYEYIALLDDDDLRLPGSLDAQLKVLEAHPEAGFVCGATLMADQNYQPTGEVIHPRQNGKDAFWDLLELNFPAMPLSTMIRKECFLRVGLLNQQVGGIDDWDIFVRIAELYPVVVVDEPVGLYRQPTPSSDQGSSSQSAQLFRAARQQLRLLKLPRAMSEAPGDRRAIRRRTRNRIADTLLFSALQQLTCREYAAACANIATALKVSPLRALRPAAYKKLANRMAANRPVLLNLN